jgi:endonuclease G
VVWESNRGVRVSAIVRYLKEAAPAGVRTHSMVQTLFNPAYTDSRPFDGVPVLPAEREANLLPTGAPAASPMQPAVMPPVHIQISIGGTAEAGAPRITTRFVEPGADYPSIESEKKFEDELDFSRCLGFNEEFLGEAIPMPVPTAKLRKQLAFHLDNTSVFTLKYHHISSIQHAVRRVPIVSAINVNAKKRYPELDEKGSRKDRWYRDNRIDYDAQLNDQWYARSGFDKGHLGRREDAEWGSSVSHAKLAADLTCSYTNAIPQVPALNRSRYGYRGLWGSLEEKLLEEGIELESGKAARICVFNGPLFSADDPVFKAVQVAMDCYKAVVWYDGQGKLRTTCFRLSQVDLVGEIEFEVLRFDQVFKTHQIALQEIEDITGLVFARRMHDTDTFAGGQDFVHEVLKDEGLKTR